MDRVCCVIDAQGFKVENQFVIRELAFVSKDFECCLEVDTLIEQNQLNKRDWTTNNYISREYTALTLRPHSTEYYSKEDVAIFVHHMYYDSCDSNKDRIGIKNDDLAVYLEQQNLPYVELNRLPSIAKLDKHYGGAWLCHHHFRSNEGVCAIRKAKYIWKYLEESEKVQKIARKTTFY